MLTKITRIIVLLTTLTIFNPLANAEDSLTRREWTIDGVTREALIYIPATATTNAAPVVFAFHGHGGSMKNAAKMFGYQTIWPEAIVVYMQGLNTPGQLTDPEGKKPGWQKSVGDQGDRDLKFFDAVLASLTKDYRVNKRRVYSTGHSNGGGFTYLLWTARGEQFAAFAPSAAVSRTLVENDPALLRELMRSRANAAEETANRVEPPATKTDAAQKSARDTANHPTFLPKPVLHVAGENDTLVKFQWQNKMIAALRQQNQCGEGKPWGADQRCTIYASKVGAPVVTYVHSGTHQFPHDAPAIIVKFFKEHTNASPLIYEGTTGPGKGKHIVFIASDHEYKSEEALPALARILAKHHGFKCTVLFGVDPKTRAIIPGFSNIPGTDALKSADLLVIFTRFQNLPVEQMQPIVDYLNRGGPVVGLRTATHGFNIPTNSPFAKYDYDYKGNDYKGGFGRQILGETWVGHYGPNHQSSTRLDLVPGKANHPILIGVSNMWAEIGAYNAYPIEGSEVLAMALPLSGMEPTSPVDPTKKPMPGAWVRTYQSASGKAGRVFTSTYGASGDLVNEGFRRMVVNACFWASGLEQAIQPNSDIRFVGPFRPTWHGKTKRAEGVTPEDLAGWDSPIWPESK